VVVKEPGIASGRQRSKENRVAVTSGRVADLNCPQITEFATDRTAFVGARELQQSAARRVVLPQGGIVIGTFSCCFVPEQDIVTNHTLPCD
jgi:hypothetical protein